MDNRSFAEGYEQQRSAQSVPENPEVAHAIEESREWASFLDTLVYDYLNENMHSPEYYQRGLQQYGDWGNDRLEGVGKIVHRNALIDPSAQRALSELHFHGMSVEAIYEYEQLVRDDVFMTDERILLMQTELAMKSAEIARQRKRLDYQEAKSGERSGIVGVYNGQLTENDTLIVLLNIVKSDPERKLVVVPGSPRFESSVNRSMNADFLIIDKALHQVRGVQAKTRIGLASESLIQYDDNRITLIDGIHDLGNSAPGEYDSRIGRKVKAAPGLIAMDFLQELDIKKSPYQAKEFRMFLMRAKAIAHELSGGRKSYVKHATENVKGKLLQDPYEGPTEPTRKFQHYYRPPEQAV